MCRFRNPVWKTLFVILTLSGQVLGQVPDLESQSRLEERPQAGHLEEQAPAELKKLVDGIDLKSSLSTQEQDMAVAISEKVKATEWLGALGPVALSPFFGLTCLSGIAIIGEDRLPEDHYLRRASSPLRNPLVFLTFLVLTILTSIPKFSKVSKPFAQAVDQLETYSAIVILLVIRFMGGIELDPGEPQVAVVYQAGFLEFSAETLLMLATVINIVVINTVKFFFEVLIWITPVPFIDAIFEATNKALCAGLAAIYAFSPTIATVINLVLLAGCLLIFAWVKRREVFYRSILCDFVRHWWSPDSGLPADGKLIVFPKQAVEGIPAMARCELTKAADGWLLRMPRWFRTPIEVRWDSERPNIETGILKNRLSANGVEFLFGKRFNRNIEQLASNLGANLKSNTTEQRPVGNLAAEMA